MAFALGSQSPKKRWKRNAMWAMFFGLACLLYRGRIGSAQQLSGSAQPSGSVKANGAGRQYDVVTLKPRASASASAPASVPSQVAALPVDPTPQPTPSQHAASQPAPSQPAAPQVEPKPASEMPALPPAAAPRGSVPSQTDSPSIAGEILTRKYGAQRSLTLQLLASRLGGADGKGAGCSSVGYEQAAPRAGSDEDLQAVDATHFFSTSAAATRTEAKGIVSRFGKFPGGLAFEGSAEGLPSFASVSFDRQFGALVLDGTFVYVLGIPPKDAADIARALATHDDDRLAVSIDGESPVIGRLRQDSEVVNAMELADAFAGELVFAENDWSQANFLFYKGVKPEAVPGGPPPMAVFFKLDGFRWAVDKGELLIREEGLAVRLVRLDDQGPSWSGSIPPALLRNAARLGAGWHYYVHGEPLFGKITRYAELTSLVRALRGGPGVDLDALAAQMDGNEPGESR